MPKSWVQVNNLEPGVPGAASRSKRTSKRNKRILGLLLWSVYVYDDGCFLMVNQTKISLSPEPLCSSEIKVSTRGPSEALKMLLHSRRTPKCCFKMTLEIPSSSINDWWQSTNLRLLIRGFAMGSTNRSSPSDPTWSFSQVVVLRVRMVSHQKLQMLWTKDFRSETSGRRWCWFLVAHDFYDETSGFPG